MHNFDELRKEYPTFEYLGYDIKNENGVIAVRYHMEIPGLSEFEPTWEFPCRGDGYADVSTSDPVLNRLIFSLGMVECISYYKLACPKVLNVHHESLSIEQLKWWRKLFYNGLGEFRYKNGIKTTKRDFLDIRCIDNDGTKGFGILHDSKYYSGCLVPVGGGKDSVVSLELLKGMGITTFTINGNQTTRNVIDTCYEKLSDYVCRRTLDKRMLDLNAEGYLNGHTPFSAIVAFATVISAYLSGRKYIALSNENSANESTVKDSNINHQYSKSFEFEEDFRWYIRNMTDSEIEYFSFLRPLTELQIAYIFSGCKKYHPVFRSCNAGSKEGIWCCNCPKCLFVYTALSPFIPEDELIRIFGEKLLDKDSLDENFRELSGIEENKPFECVGTRREVQICAKTYIQRGARSLLTDRYKDILMKSPLGEKEMKRVLSEWNSEHNLPEEFEKLLRAKLDEYSR
ncbi:MAG: hypothetical protein IJ608_07760 [Lachnospiraceae bacterium]|nr:hypothetical protein [Lachnospiraceae bacterium]